MVCRRLQFGSGAHGHELEVGQPVSVGLSVFESGGTYLSEVSVVYRGAIEGAEIWNRVAEAAEAHAILAGGEGTTSTPAAVGEEVFYGGPLIRRNIGHVTAIGGRRFARTRGTGRLAL